MLIPEWLPLVYYSLSKLKVIKAQLHTDHLAMRGQEPFKFL